MSTFTRAAIAAATLIVLAGCSGGDDGPDMTTTEGACAVLTEPNEFGDDLILQSTVVFGAVIADFLEEDTDTTELGAVLRELLAVSAEAPAEIAEPLDALIVTLQAVPDATVEEMEPLLDDNDAAAKTLAELCA